MHAILLAVPVLKSGGNFISLTAALTQISNSDILFVFSRSFFSSTVVVFRKNYLFAYSFSGEQNAVNLCISFHHIHPKDYGITREVPMNLCISFHHIHPKDYGITREVPIDAMYAETGNHA